MRVTIETDKHVNPSQLADELATTLDAAPPAVSARDPGQPDGEGGVLPGAVAVDGDVTEDVLRDVVAAHVAVDPPPPDPAVAPLTDDEIVAVRALLNPL